MNIGCFFVVTDTTWYSRQVMDTLSWASANISGKLGRFHHFSFGVFIPLTFCLRLWVSKCLAKTKKLQSGQVEEAIFRAKIKIFGRFQGSVQRYYEVRQYTYFREAICTPARSPHRLGCQGEPDLPVWPGSPLLHQLSLMAYLGGSLCQSRKTPRTKTVI